MPRKTHFLIGTRWFGVLGPCQILIDQLVDDGYDVFVFGQSDDHFERYDKGNARLVRLYMARSYISPIRDILDVIKLMAFILWYRQRIFIASIQSLRFCLLRPLWFGLGQNSLSASLDWATASFAPNRLNPPSALLCGSPAFAHGSCSFKTPMMWLCSKKSAWSSLIKSECS